jgi:hypothetical protein
LGFVLKDTFVLKVQEFQVWLIPALQDTSLIQKGTNNFQIVKYALLDIIALNKHYRSPLVCVMLDITVLKDLYQRHLFNARLDFIAQSVRHNR